MDSQTDRSTFRTMWLGLAAMVLLPFLAIAAVALVADKDGTTPATAGAPVSRSVELGDLFVKPSKIEVPAGAPVRLTVHNGGKSTHDLKVEGLTGTRMLAPGTSQTIDAGPFTKSVKAWCTVPGHKDAGMVLDVVVAGTATPATGTAAESGNSAVIDHNATPPADWRPYDPALAPAPGGREHRVTLHAVESLVEVAPGVTQELWTFNGAAPGPTLRGRVGDLFTVELVNDGKLGHSIDFHASKVAWTDEMRTIQPGESLTYQFVAGYAGVFMYHCGTAPALHHIGNGMFGAVVIDPPDLSAVDHEYLLVQSELYLGPDGGPGDLTKMQRFTPDAVVFNGYVDQYKHAPIRVEPEQRVRVWVLDAGPSDDSAFHVVGTVFDTVFKEGTYLLRPDGRRGGSQVLDLQPAQGGFVEFTFDEPGLYPIVTHKFSNVGKGALGLFQAGEAQSSGTAGH